MKVQAVNPFLPSYEYVPDAEPYVFDSRIYIYGSHDRFGGEDFCMNDYVCWSAPIDDLGEWKNEGVIYKSTQDPFNPDATQHLFAPDMQVGADGRYYLFYCLHKSPTVSVAVCDTPAGQFQFYGHIHYADGTLYGEKSKDVFNFDPGIFRDDDGKIYMYTGISHPRNASMRKYLEGLYKIDGSYCVELEEDMLTVKGEPKLVLPGEICSVSTGFEGHAFFEASSPRKIDGKYYLIYSSEKSHDLCYAVSTSPMSGFKYGGVIVSIGDVGIVDDEHALNYLGNTHGGLLEISGQWYIFYHRHTNQSRNCRQMCAEKISLEADGSIQQVEVTSCGLNKGALKGQGRYEARIACNLLGSDGTFMYQKDKPSEEGMHPYFTQDGGDRENNPGQYIANMCNGAWAGFKYFDMKESGTIMLCIRGHAKGNIVVSDERGGEARAVIPVQESDEWYKTSCEYKMPAGKRALYFIFEGTGRLDWLWFELEEKKMLDENTKIGELLKDERARSIMNEYLSGMADKSKINMVKGFSLKALCAFPQVHINQEQYEQCIAELKKL